MDFTTNQSQAINSTNSKILVSAGAGSGKTAVLSSRVLKLVEEGTPLSQIMVVTFTKMAAAEMKARIKNKLRQSQNEFAVQQAENVENAPITTLHAFASRILKQYFFYVGLDPTFKVLEETTAQNLKYNAISTVMRRLTAQNNEDFFDLADILFQNRKDENMRNAILKLDDFLVCEPHPQDYINKVKDHYQDCQNQALEFMIFEVAERARFFKEKLNILSVSCAEKHASKLQDAINELEFHLSRIKPNNSLSQMRIAINDFSAPTKILRNSFPELAEELAALKTQIKKFFDNLADMFCTSKSEDELEAEAKQTAKRTQNLLELWQQYHNEYTSQKELLGVLDFSDLERKLFELLKDENLNQQITKNFTHVFVDEFQDTNRLQQAIYQKLAKNNVFFVGDVKQSIYAFRQAEPQIFVDTRSQFRKSNGEVVTLSDNFRSHQELIEFTNMLFETIMSQNMGGEDYKTEGKMSRGGSPFPNVGPSGLLARFSANYFPRIKICAIKKAKTAAKEEEELPLYSVENHKNASNVQISSAIAEGKVLAKILKQLSSTTIYDAKQNIERKVSSADIAVLSASRGEYLKTLLQTAQEEGYSFAPDTSTDIFEDCDMQELLNLLMLASNPQQDIPLFVVLSGNFVGLTSNELAQIKVEFGNNCKYFYQTINNFVLSEKVPNGLKDAKQKVLNLNKLLEDIRFELSYKTISETINTIVNSTDFLFKISQKTDGEQKVLLLESLIEQLGNLPANNDLDDFLWTAQNIGFVSADQKEAEAGTAVVDNGNAVVTFQNINVTTIHKSKGLEYPIVILVGAGRPFNRDDLNKDFLLSKNFGIALSSFDSLERVKSNNLLKSSIRLELQKQSLEESIRVLYVAITRAVNHLVIIGTGDPTEPDTINKNILSSNNFFDLISKYFNGQLPKSYLEVSKESFEMLSENSKTEVPVPTMLLPHNDQMVEEIKRGFLQEYPFAESTKLSQKYSVTELAQKEKIVNLKPMAAESTSDIGNAYHHIMQHISFRATTPEALQKEREYLTQSGLTTEEEWNLVDCEKILNCLNSPLFIVLSNGKRKILREQQFIMQVAANKVGLSKTVTDKVLVQGVFDMVVFDKDYCLIVDYKTGGAATEEELKQKHKKQMELYAMAAQMAFDMPVKTAIYSFAMQKLIRL